MDRKPRARILRLSCLALALAGCRAADLAAPSHETTLPAPRTSSSNSLEALLASNKSVRSFSLDEITLDDTAQLLWATRAAPILGAVPLDIYVARADGVLRYSAKTHAAVKVVPADVRKAIAQATGEPDELRSAPLLIVIVGQPEKGRATYGARADRFAAVEAGQASQTILLQAASLGLAATPLALFDDDAVRDALLLPRDHVPLQVIGVGKP